MLKIVWFLATLSSSTAQSFYNKMQCANCSHINMDCAITTTGWSCEFELDALKLDEKMNSTGMPPLLQPCVLPGMGFIREKALMGYCCFWSPEMGCQKLRRNDIDTEGKDQCHSCSRTIWSSLMENKTCPCGKWFLDTEDRAGGLRSRDFMLIWASLCTFVL
ncbi:uncharacterized protein LOC108034726 [Drosophila biarmipes]|uniref:uncharacterized protein LOC108034726 n=1 Tax=Drosophila biarmipes TaxID=125945 RepID=UPI0007E60686|nr:uncharacterized protein LOC108034726 [Drosophila biarmipes]